MRIHAISSDSRAGRAERASATKTNAGRGRTLDVAGAPTREDRRGSAGFDLDEAPVNLLSLRIDLVRLRPEAEVDDVHLGLDLDGRFLAGHGASPVPIVSRAGIEGI